MKFSDEQKTFLDELKRMRSLMLDNAALMCVVVPDCQHIAELKGAADCVDTWINGFYESFNKNSDVNLTAG